MLRKSNNVCHDKLKFCVCFFGERKQGEIKICFVCICKHKQYERRRDNLVFCWIRNRNADMTRWFHFFWYFVFFVSCIFNFFVYLKIFFVFFNFNFFFTCVHILIHILIIIWKMNQNFLRSKLINFFNLYHWNQMCAPSRKMSCIDNAVSDMVNVVHIRNTISNIYDNNRYHFCYDIWKTHFFLKRNIIFTQNFFDILKIKIIKIKKESNR